MSMAPQPHLAMQGGNIKGDAQQEIEKAAQRLIALLRAQMALHGSPAEHADQELASLVVQVFIEECDPTSFVEGALTQLGWQLAVRAGDQLTDYIAAAEQWFSTGLTYGAREPLSQQAVGSA